ncbi:hypothetical protein ANANG_G00117500 [Anguilla anguilla]|uniref:Mediator of RNA polymerase II transcription subunit 23 n=1 Tax=Anguilla anguilla TaxID=7936 RepID=A0A9D3RXD0_ANGAN|nr:hypothetical protein ANANG_G00117500 [Anguilla anguilla]
MSEPYWVVLHDRIVSVINSPALTTETEWVGYLFQLFDFTACHQSYSEMYCSYVLALAHAVWHHSSIGQLSLIPKFLSEVLKPIVKTEFQLLYVYHLVGPFLQRFQQERTRCMLEIGVAFYEMLQTVDQHSQHLAYMDPICDFLYHVKVHVHGGQRQGPGGEDHLHPAAGREATATLHHAQQQDGARRSRRRRRCGRHRAPAPNVSSPPPSPARGPSASPCPRLSSAHQSRSPPPHPNHSEAQ